MAAEVMNPKHMVAVTDVHYRAMMQRALAMKPQKRHLFKGHVCDKQGARSAVVYKDGGLWERCTGRRVVSLATIDVESLTPLTSTAVLLNRLRHGGADAITEHVAATHHIHTVIAGNATGNHHRNHYVRVPQHATTPAYK